MVFHRHSFQKKLESLQWQPSSLLCECLPVIPIESISNVGSLAKKITSKAILHFQLKTRTTNRTFAFGCLWPLVSKKNHQKDSLPKVSLPAFPSLPGAARGLPLGKSLGHDSQASVLTSSSWNFCSLGMLRAKKNSRQQRRPRNALHHRHPATASELLHGLSSPELAADLMRGRRWGPNIPNIATGHVMERISTVLLPSF